MVFDKIRVLMESCSTETPHFLPTLLYNEGKQLRYETLFQPIT